MSGRKKYSATLEEMEAKLGRVMELLEGGSCSTCKHNKKSHSEKYCGPCIEATFTSFQHPECKYPEFPEYEPKED